MKNLILTVSLLTVFCVASQTTYDDVAVIINDNSQTSIDIANYFQSARDIPNQNMIHIFAASTEKVDSLQFEQIRAQIESHLINNSLTDSINYLVTTKGVPLKVNSGCVIDTVPGAPCASFDSELALIMGPLSNSIGHSGAVTNPFYNETSNFNRDSVGIYLVTRLDGYSKDDIFSLIDNSGPYRGINKLSAKCVLDVSNAIGQDSVYFASKLEPSNNYLVNNSWNVIQDFDTAPLVNQDEVFAYLGIGHGPLPSANFNYDWTKGAVGVMSMCSSAFSFDGVTNPENSFLVADLIADGCTGAIGHVEEVYFSQLFDNETFLNRYLDTTKNYNLAESFYMGEKTLSWQTVVVGDPKASIVIDNLATLFESEEPEAINIYPNPSTGTVNIIATETIDSVTAIDMKGKIIKNYTPMNSNSVKLDLKGVQSGIYIVQIEIGGNLTQRRIVINN